MQDPLLEVMGNPLPDEIEIVPVKTALLVIDMQRMNAHRDGLIGRQAKARGEFETIRWRFERMEAIVPNIKRLLTICRRMQIQVIYLMIQAWRRDARDMGRWLREC